jgi:hypothetical protein
VPLCYLCVCVCVCGCVCVCVFLSNLCVSPEQAQDQNKPKRRCRKRDPAEQPSQPWTEEEIAQFRTLVKTEGATAWKDKSAKLARLCGNIRTPKALHTRYLREIGRIVDRPRCALADESFSALRHACSRVDATQDSARSSGSLTAFLAGVCVCM